MNMPYFHDDFRKHACYCDCSSDQGFEGHTVLTKGNTGHTILASADQEMVKGVILDVKGWLPYAAEVYNISADLKDYVMVPVPIMYNDAPNRNGVGFSYAELTRFNPQAGMIAYETWRRKPTFEEHNNKDHTRAKGVILDVSMRTLAGYPNYSKVVNLLAFDRSRDPILANGILTKERTSYSMGAMCHDYTCSICDASVNKGGCEHTQINRPQFKTVATAQGTELAYLQAINFCGFETSSVKVPAYYQATNSQYMSVG